MENQILSRDEELGDVGTRRVLQWHSLSPHPSVRAMIPSLTPWGNTTLENRQDSHQVIKAAPSVHVLLEHLLQVQFIFNILSQYVS